MKFVDVMACTCGWVIGGGTNKTKNKVQQKKTEDIYKLDEENSFLYENVIFANVSPVKMIKFFNIFDFNDIDAGLWDRLKERMCKNVVRDANYNSFNRYYNVYILDLIKSGKFKIKHVNENSITAIIKWFRIIFC